MNSRIRLEEGGVLAESIGAASYFESSAVTDENVLFFKREHSNMYIYECCYYFCLN